MFAPHQAVEIPMMPRFVPTAVPALLSFVAGYIDSCMFLALFGLFVAQVTGSFVLTGVQFVMHDLHVGVRVVGIPAFFLPASRQR